MHIYNIHKVRTAYNHHPLSCCGRAQTNLFIALKELKFRTALVFSDQVTLSFDFVTGQIPPKNYEITYAFLN